jgi:alpha-L-fucosidase
LYSFGSDTPGAHAGFYTPEYSATVYLNHKWEENSGIDIHSYGLNRNTPAEDYYTTDYLIKLLVRCIANNGNLLLDIGPNYDGKMKVFLYLEFFFYCYDYYYFFFFHF